MKTTILEHEIEFSWKEGVKNHLDNNDTEHIEEEIKKGNRGGELCQSVGAEGEIFGWWEIKNYENEAMKEMQKAEKLEYALNEIDGMIDNIETLMLDMPFGETEIVDNSVEGINNLIAIIKTKIEETKENSVDKE